MIKEFTVPISEYDNHRLVSFVSDPISGLSGFIALHRGNGLVPAFGATRLANYKDLGEALEDALKLSKFMSYKSALAGLTYGGGKGVIIKPQSRKVNMKNLLRAYAGKVNLLGGHFITGADVGISQLDVNFMSKESPYIVGVSSNPVYYTAFGLLQGLKVCLKEYFGTMSLTKRTFAIQGVGKIGEAFLDLIYKKAKLIYISDLDQKRLRSIKRKYPKVVLVPVKDIYSQRVDVFSPCALSNALNSHSITKLACSIVLGGANNQLNNKTAGQLLHKLGILYAPDYVVNAGGFISVVDEYEHKHFDSKRTTKRILGIANTLSQILEQSKRRNKGTNIIADEMAEKIFNNH